jgi:tetratricopeptide (TPR) repeat protein
MRHILFSLTLISLVLTTCQQNDTQTTDQTTAQVAIPELLERPTVISAPEEADQVTNMYSDLRSKIEANSDDIKARLTLAELFMQEARVSGEHGHYFPAALAVLNAVLEEEQLDEGNHYRAMLNKASVLLSLHQFAEAKKIGEQALALNKYDAGIYGVLVDANVELGHYEAAVKMADKMISVRPDIRSYSRISYLREIHGQAEGAIEAMKLAVSAGYPGQEQTEWARLVLGDLYKEYGQLDKAEAQYQQALVHRPNYPFAVAALAETEALKGNMAEAKTLYQEAADLIPEVGFYMELAKIEQEQGHEEKAQALTDEIMVMLADDEASGHKMGLEYSEVYMDLKGDLDQALAYAKKEYEARPDNIDVNSRLAVIYYHRSELDLAAQHLAKARKTNSQNPELLCLDGLLHLKNATDHTDGDQLIRSAFAANPNLDCSYCGEARELL